MGFADDLIKNKKKLEEQMSGNSGSSFADTLIANKQLMNQASTIGTLDNVNGVAPTIDANTITNQLTNAVKQTTPILPQKDNMNLGQKLGYVGESFGSGILGGATQMINAPAQNVQEGAERAQNNTTAQNLQSLLYKNMLPGSIGRIPDVINGLNKIAADPNMGGWKKALNMALEIANGYSFAGKLEDVGQLYGFAQQLLNRNGAKDIQQSRDILQTPSNTLQKDVAKKGENLSGGWQLAGQVGQATGNMIPSIGLSLLTGDPSSASAQALSLASMGVSAKGQATEEALNKGANLSEANRIGAAKGMVEVGTEKLTGGLSWFGKGPADQIAEKIINDNVKNSIANFALKKIIGGLGEVGEEVISDIAGIAIDKATTDPDASLKSYFKNGDFWNTVITTLLTTGILETGYDVAGKAMTGKSAYQINKEELGRIGKVQDMVNEEISNTDTSKMSNKEINDLKSQLETKYTNMLEQGVRDIISQADEEAFYQGKRTGGSELQEVEQQDIKDTANALNLEESPNIEENIEENIQEENATTPTATELELNLENQTQNQTQNNINVTTGLEDYIKNNNLTELTQQNIDDYINQILEEQQANLTEQERKSLIDEYQDIIKNYAKDNGIPVIEAPKIEIPDMTAESKAPSKAIGKETKNAIQNQVNAFNNAVKGDQYKVGNQVKEQYKNLEQKSINKLDNDALFYNQLEQKKNTFTQKQGNYVYQPSNNPRIDAFRRSAATYFKNNGYTQAFAKVAEKVIRDKGISIKFDPNLKSNAQITNKDSIVINPNSNRAAEFLLTHELTHAIGNKQMLKMIETYRKSNAEFDEAVKKLIGTYKASEISEEALADISGQLFGNQEFINNLSMEKPSLFKKLYNEIKYMWHQFRGYKNQNEFIEDLYNKWTDAYTKNIVKNKNTANSNVEMSNQVDSKGDKLSQGQANYFKDSKVRDNNGRLLEVYRGDDNTFNVFDREKAGTRGSYYASGFYFTSDPNEASFYGDVNNYYLDIKNPYKPSVDIINKDGSVSFAPSFYEELETKFKRDLPNNWNELKGKKKGDAARDILEKNGYDGVFNGTNYVAFNSNQIKNIDNLTPTTNDDIRYSIEETNGGTKYVVDNKLKKDSNLTQKDIFNSLKNKEYTFEDGDKAYIVGWLYSNDKNTKNKYMYDELFKRQPSMFKNIDDIKDFNKLVNYNTDELLKTSQKTQDAIKDINNKHKNWNIDSFDTRQSILYDDTNNKAYLIDFSVANLKNGKKIAYAKKMAQASDDILNKIKTSSMGENSQIAGVDNNISQNKDNVKSIQGLEDYTREEIKNITNDYIKQVLKDNGYDDIEIIDSDIHGSRGRGTAKADSDLDIVVQYDGDLREDDFFNMLNDNGDDNLYINDIKVDINPIKENLSDYMERSNEYDKEVLNKNTKSSKEELDNSSFSLKQKQNDIIQKYNPKDEELGEHTWINSVDDIKTFKEALDYDDYESGNLTPDFTENMVQEALKTGKVTIYSSYPIEQGTFVTPSKTEAESYAGSNKVYSKEVPLEDVAWIDSLQGQYAKVDEKYSKDNQTWREYLEKEFPSQGTRTDLDAITGRKPTNKVNDITKQETPKKVPKNPITDSVKAMNLEKETKKAEKTKKDRDNLAETKKDEVVQLKTDKGKKIDLKKTSDNIYERVETPKKTDVMPDMSDDTVTIGDKKVSNFYSNITEKSKFITEENRASLQDNKNLKYYNAITNKDTLLDAMGKLDANAEQQIGDFFAKDSFNAEDMATGWILIKRYQDAGNYEAMSNVIETMREKGTKSGQAIQMLGMLDRLTPEGMEFYAQRQLDNAYNKFVENKSKKEIDKFAQDFTLTPEEHQFIKDTMEKVEKMTNEDDKKVEVAKIVKMLSDKLPPEKGSRVKAWMRISMLGNPKTQVRNVAGNAIIQPLNWLGDTVASRIDKIMSKKTGIRTKGDTDFGALAGGFVKGAKEAVRDAKLGIDTRDINLNRFEENIGAKPFYEGHKSKALNAGAKALNKTNQILGNVMSGGDRVFYQAIYDNSLKNQMKLNNVTTPTQEMMQIAEQEALSRTWNDSNEYTKAVLQIRNAMNKLNVKGYGLGDVLVPFAKTPANLTKAIVDYSPVGLVRSILQDGKNYRNSLQNGQYNAQIQHKFADSLGKGFAGTILWAAAYALAQAGITSGASDDDKDVANFMRNTLGIQPYSVKIGNKSFTYDWAQPIAAPFAAMADFKRLSEKEEKDFGTIVQTAISSASNILLEQSFLSSIQDVFNSYEGPAAAIKQQIEDLPARATPTFFKQIADLIDPVQRQTYVKGNTGETLKNKVQVKIPGASKELTSQRDTLGREIKKYGGDDNIAQYAFNVFLNPANTNKGKPSAAAEEIYDVYKNTGDKTVMPRQVGYSENVGGTTIPLSAEERNEWQRLSGEKIEDSVKALTSNPKYNSMSYEDKADVINGIVNYSFAKAKSDMFGTQISTQYKTASKKEAEGIPIADYYVDRISKRK